MCGAEAARLALMWVLFGWQVACKPGSITPHKKFEGEIYCLNKEEGGRHTPFFTNYKPQFFFRTADITGASADYIIRFPSHCVSRCHHVPPNSGENFRQVVS